MTQLLSQRDFRGKGDKAESETSRLCSANLSSPVDHNVSVVHQIWERRRRMIYEDARAVYEIFTMIGEDRNMY